MSLLDGSENQSVARICAKDAKWQNEPRFLQSRRAARLLGFRILVWASESLPQMIFQGPQGIGEFFRKSAAVNTLWDLALLLSCFDAHMIVQAFDLTL